MDNEARAFPFVSHGGVHEHQFFSAGMTLRDYFAAKAMQAILSNTETLQRISKTATENLISPDCLVATGAYALADAMIKERVK